MIGVTQRQQDVLDAIRSYVSSHGGIYPTQREIGAMIGMHPSAVNLRITELEKRGRLRRLDKARRGIELVQSDPISFLGNLEKPFADQCAAEGVTPECLLREMVAGYLGYDQ